MNARQRSEAGNILLIVLGMIILTSFLALGLVKLAVGEMALAKFPLGKCKAQFMAWAGFIDAIPRIKAGGNGYKKILFEEGYSDVQEFQYEENKINLNSLDEGNLKLFQNLIGSMLVDDDTTRTIANAAVDWQDEDNVKTGFPFGAEDRFYGSLAKPYRCKNRPFDHIEEMMFLEGMTPEIFAGIKQRLTIFPKIPSGQGGASRYVSISIRGVETNSNVQSIIEAVVLRDDLSVVYWHRD